MGRAKENNCRITSSMLVIIFSIVASILPIYVLGFRGIKSNIIIYIIYRITCILFLFAFFHLAPLRNHNLLTHTMMRAKKAPIVVVRVIVIHAVFYPRNTQRSYTCRIKMNRTWNLIIFLQTGNL